MKPDVCHIYWGGEIWYWVLCYGTWTFFFSIIAIIILHELQFLYTSSFIQKTTLEPSSKKFQIDFQTEYMLLVHVYLITILHQMYSYIFEKFILRVSECCSTNVFFPLNLTILGYFISYQHGIGKEQYSSWNLGHCLHGSTQSKATCILSGVRVAQICLVRVLLGPRSEKLSLHITGEAGP